MPELVKVPFTRLIDQKITALREHAQSTGNRLLEIVVEQLAEEVNHMVLALQVPAGAVSSTEPVDFQKRFYELQARVCKQFPIEPLWQDEVDSIKAGSRVDAIKMIRNRLPNCGLKEAKDAVERNATQLAPGDDRLK